MFNALRGSKRDHPLAWAEFHVISNRSQSCNLGSMIAVGSGPLMSRARAKLRVSTEAECSSFRHGDSKFPPSEGHLLSVELGRRDQALQDNFSPLISQEV